MLMSVASAAFRICWLAWPVWLAFLPFDSYDHLDFNPFQGAAAAAAGRGIRRPHGGARRVHARWVRPKVEYGRFILRFTMY